MGYPHEPHPHETVVLSQYFGDADARSYKGWVKRGGYQALKQALGADDPAAVLAITKQLAADFVVTGSVTPLHASFFLMSGSGMPFAWQYGKP